MFSKATKLSSFSIFEAVMIRDGFVFVQQALFVEVQKSDVLLFSQITIVLNYKEFLVFSGK